MIVTEFTVEHIDDCYPDALTDHHNREGECLIGVPVDATTTVQQVFDALYGEAVDAELPDGVTAEQIAEACSKEVFGALTPSDVWNSDLEAGDNNGEGPQAWFVLRWEV
jgi:hypothetical protein